MPEYYRDRIERLVELERLSQLGKIDLYYGDESHICSEGYLPYGWPRLESWSVSNLVFLMKTYFDEVLTLK
ncbi:MAG: hypothetical protein LBP64_09920 [Tannerella sp.]|jgi:hypothetical protein|nr:hypothetical protein [Tannerella sp.]